MPSNLRIDPERLWAALMETAAIGGTAKGGINRQTLTAEDGVVRAWFKREAEALGCKVTVDEVGNMLALRPGRQPDLAPIALGSHLDTQPTGGKFDGVLGVLGALEAMRTLVAAGYETNAPIMVINWTNEEGGRFAPAMLGSGVFAGVYSRAEADAMKDIAGVRFGEALDGIGWRGPTRRARPSSRPTSSCTSSRGRSWRRRPRPSASSPACRACAGTRRPSPGAKAMPAPRRCRGAPTRWRPARASSLDVRAIALAHAPTAVGTVGRVEVKPNSPNVIPGEVSMTVDLRHHDDAVLQAMETSCAPRSSAWAPRRRSRSRRGSCTTCRRAFRSRVRRGRAGGGGVARLSAPRHHLGRRP